MSAAPGGAVRVDRWLWAVRLFPSRTQATEACGRGRVLVNGQVAKPAMRVTSGDEIEVRVRHRERRVLVLDPIEQRVGAPVALTCYEDRTPPAADAGSSAIAPPPPPAIRERGAGRPTKRDRRRMDALRSLMEEPSERAPEKE